MGYRSFSKPEESPMIPKGVFQVEQLTPNPHIRLLSQDFQSGCSRPLIAQRLILNGQ